MNCWRHWIIPTSGGEGPQRLLNERHQLLMDPPMFEKIAKLATGPNTANNAAMHALWLLVSQNTIDADLLQKLLSHSDETVRAWAVRAVGNAGRAPQPIAQKLIEMATKDPSPSVRVQIPIAAGRLTREDPCRSCCRYSRTPPTAKTRSSRTSPT